VVGDNVVGNDVGDTVGANEGEVDVGALVGGSDSRGPVVGDSVVGAVGGVVGGEVTAKRKEEGDGCCEIIVAASQRGRREQKALACACVCALKINGALESRRNLQEQLYGKKKLRGQHAQREASIG
jgi:hypothetical protein